MDRRIVPAVIMVALAAGACGKKQPPAPPQPQTQVDTAALNRAREDSIRAAQEAAAAKARAEQEAAARAAEAAAAQARQALQAPIYFEYDEASLSDEAKQNLDQKVALLRANPDVQVRIAGNADERGSVEYNLALGMRRAEAAKQYVTGFGVDAGRLATVSYGEERPADPGHDEAAWSKNRRDEFEITAGGERIQPASGTGGR